MFRHILRKCILVSFLLCSFCAPVERLSKHNAEFMVFIPTDDLNETITLSKLKTIPKLDNTSVNLQLNNHSDVTVYYRLENDILLFTYSESEWVEVKNRTEYRVFGPAVNGIFKETDAEIQAEPGYGAGMVDADPALGFLVPPVNLRVLVTARIYDEDHNVIKTVAAYKDVVIESKDN